MCSIYSTQKQLAKNIENWLNQLKVSIQLFVQFLILFLIFLFSLKYYPLDDKDFLYFEYEFLNVWFSILLFLGFIILCYFVALNDLNLWFLLIIKLYIYVCIYITGNHWSITTRPVNVNVKCFCFVPLSVALNTFISVTVLVGTD